MENNKNNATLETVMKSLLDVFETEEYEKNIPWVTEIVEQYKHLNLKEPEYFEMLTDIELESKSRILSKVIVYNFNIEDEHKQFILQNYFMRTKFICNHLENLIIRLNGSMCSFDKVRWLINSYLDYILTSNIPVVEERKFWIPSKGDISLWFNFITSILKLYDGDSDEYFLYKTVLIQNYQKS